MNTRQSQHPSYSETDLLAYLFHELPPKEKAKLEQALASDVALQAQLAALQKTVGQIHEAFAVEANSMQSDAELTPGRLKQLEQAMEKHATPRSGWLTRWLNVRVLAPTLSMATLLIVAVVFWQQNNINDHFIIVASKKPQAQLPLQSSVDHNMAVSDREQPKEPAEQVLQKTTREKTTAATSHSGTMSPAMGDDAAAPSKNMQHAQNTPAPLLSSKTKTSQSLEDRIVEQTVDEIAEEKADHSLTNLARSAKKAQATSTQSYLVPAAPPMQQPDGYIYQEQSMNTEAYDYIAENTFIQVNDDPLSTFSIDVDTASYANARRFLTQGQLPPADAIRIEELINYFQYDDPAPSGKHPFAVNLEMASAPWNPQHQLVRIGLKAKVIDWKKRPANNLVFLLDVSGSMSDFNKLPLLKQAFGMLVEKLDQRDRVAIVVYAGASGLVLESTPGNQQTKIMQALNQLQAGGSTNGGQGIELAYQIAKQYFIVGGSNRVVLATDGDFNVGVTSQGDLTRLIQEQAKSGVFLSVLGFGMGNYKDSTLEQLASKGNGNYAYIDTLKEAEKVLVKELTGTLVTVAKDVKLQIEFNPAQVAAYRLIGYENRKLAHQDFNDDRKDAGDMGAGHSVTALYEVVPSQADTNVKTVDPLKYQPSVHHVGQANSTEWLTVKLRYKQPNSEQSSKFEVAFKGTPKDIWQSSANLKFSAAVAGFGMKLRHSTFAQDLSWGNILELANSGLGNDRQGNRLEFISLIERAQVLTSRQQPEPPVFTPQ